MVLCNNGSLNKVGTYKPTVDTNNKSSLPLTNKINKIPSEKNVVYILFLCSTIVPNIL